MTDITELAQQLKAAAEKATPGEWVYFPKNTSIEYDVGSDESQGSILYVDSGDFTQAQTDRNGEFIALANPANILALVEALEKAQQRITQMESRTVTDWIEHDGKWRPESLGLDELVYLKTRKQELKIPYPAGKVKGWMNTGGDMDVMAYKLASPQASTVTVKLPLPRRKTADDYVDDTFEPCDLAAVYNACRLECEVKFKNALTAAGIKVEAE
ncbi:TPA: ead/Ea22-like family protein [Klebsiella pneumoniae]|nr:ead/Ea22-like family protein [Klebsiella pneumoniae]HCF8816638.1 ead/Ea22-like family protein [Klebsiella pneumoniae]